MSKIIGYFFAFLLVIGVLMWTLAIVLGGAELLWWIFTGDFFHFMSVNAEAVSAF